MEKGYPHRRKT